VKATIGICMLADYSMAKKCQQAFMAPLPGKRVNSNYLQGK
jgi:hypothetical protein